jgi:NAD(P)-dependent dehydrogenase (short-subunit alcohol dehydrogenase family)
MGKLHDQLILVAGGGGTIGKGITSALIKEGATVVVPSRSIKSINDLLENYIDKDSSKKLIGIEADIGKEEGIIVVSEIILSELNKNKNLEFKHVVSTLGSMQKFGNISEHSLEDFKLALNDLCVSHFSVLKKFLPEIKNSKIKTLKKRKRIKLHNNIRRFS